MSAIARCDGCVHNLVGAGQSFFPPSVVLLAWLRLSACCHRSLVHAVQHRRYSARAWPNSCMRTLLCWRYFPVSCRGHQIQCDQNVFLDSLSFEIFPGSCNDIFISSELSQGTGTFLLLINGCVLCLGRTVSQNKPSFF